MRFLFKILFLTDVKQLHDTLSFLVTIKDRLDSDHDSENDNLVKVPINVIILDENDNSPAFQNVSSVQQSSIALLKINCQNIFRCHMNAKY